MINRVLCTLTMLAAAPAAFAAQPVPWAIGLQPPANPVAVQANDFHTLVTIISFLIAIFVLSLLGYTIWRFAAPRNPIPTQTTHNTTVEVLWTVIPILILVAIAIPSMRLLYAITVTKDVEMTIKAVGHQWYWSYEYPDHGNFTFDAYMMPDDDVRRDRTKVRLLSTDNPVVIPVDTRIRVLVTATDVLHSWAVPAFFTKVDGVPGRANELLIDKVTRPGTYYGQCSELCGVNHSYMPIEVKVVSKADFQTWVREAQRANQRVGGLPPVTPAVDVANTADVRPVVRE